MTRLSDGLYQLMYELNPTSLAFSRWGTFFVSTLIISCPLERILLYLLAITIGLCKRYAQEAPLKALGAGPPAGAPHLGLSRAQVLLPLASLCLQQHHGLLPQRRHLRLPMQQQSAAQEQRATEPAAEASN